MRLALHGGMNDERVLFYDGPCGLCQRVNLFVLARDRRDRFRFAALQSELARAVLRRHGRSAEALDTFYVVLGYGTLRERLLSKSTAAIDVLVTIGGVWRLAALARVIPAALRDRVYDWIARSRYRWFGRRDACALPRPEWRGKFLDA